LTNADLERVVDTNDEWIVQRTGIRERRVAAAHETTATLSAIAGKRAIAVAGLEPDDIDVILVATLTPDYWMPSTGALVKEAIGNTTAAAMDVMAACSGFVYAYSAADAYLRSGAFRHALVIGAETLSALPRLLRPLDVHPLRRRRRGGRAVGVRGGGRRHAGPEMTTDPDGAYMIWLPSGGSRSARPPARRSRAASTSSGWRARRPTATRPRRWPPPRSQAIERAGWDPDEIDLFIPHQANVRIIESVAKGLGLPMDKMFVNVDRYGNTSAASVGIALAEAVDMGRIKVGDKVVLVAFGAGLTSGAIALEWTADPAHGARAEAVEPVASVREPLDWSSVDPIPIACARSSKAMAVRLCRSTMSCLGSPSRPSKLAQEIGLSWPATTRQLRLLQRAGLITARRGYADRRLVVYFIEPKRLGQITAWLAGTEVGRAFPEPKAAEPPNAGDGSA
jgi:3-oxoacyl-[acyl-carrier-protein] synthase III